MLSRRPENNMVSVHLWGLTAITFALGAIETSFAAEFGNFLLQNRRTSFEDCSLRNLEFPIGDLQLYPSAVGGQPALPQEFAHMAAIGWTTNDKIEWLCGGSLITETFILSAAHCASKDSVSPDKARMGDLNLESSDDDDYAQEINIAEIIRHERHSFKAGYYDIALFRLEKPIKIHETVCPACLWTDNDFDELPRLAAAGWGTVGHGEKSSPILNKVELTPSDYRSCNEFYEGNSRVKNGLESHQMCAGDNLMDTCPGDSGGPLEKKFSYNSRLIPFVVGITSFGPACGFGTPAVYVKVSSFIPWIQAITNTTFDPIECSNRNYIHRDLDDDVILGERTNIAGKLNFINEYFAVIQKRKSTRYDAEQVLIGTIKNGLFVKFCSGVLLTESYILTTASCLNGIRPTHVRLMKLENTEISQIIIHPKFDAINLFNDIGVVKLKNPVTFSPTLYPVCPWTEPTIPPDLSLHGLGVGPLLDNIWVQPKAGENIMANTTDIEFNLFIVNNSDCNQLYRSNSKRISEDQLCAGNGKFFLVPGACELDAGNSLFGYRFNETTKSSTHYIFGLNSLRKNCGFGSTPAVFTKVSNYVSWLESIVFKTDNLVSSSSTTSVYKDGALFFEDDKESGACDYAAKDDGQCVPVSDCLELADKFRLKSTHVNFCSLKNGGRICCPSHLVRSKEDVQAQNFIDACVKKYASYRIKVKPNSLPFFDLYDVFDRSRSQYPGEFQHAALVGWKQPSGDPKWKCVASLISPKFVITAAYCLELENSLPDMVALGQGSMKNDSSASVQQFSVAEIVKHPDFNPITRKNDIALIRLRGTVKITKDVVPICLWSNKTHTPLTLSTVTMGILDKENNYILQARLSTTIENARCARAQTRVISDKEICTVIYESYDSSKVQLHPGDQLQSHFPVTGKFVPFLLGINKYDYDHKADGKPIVFTRISEYVNWITSIV